MYTERSNMDLPSFAYGAMSIVALVGVRQIMKLFSAPTTDHIEQMAKKPIGLIGDSDKITVFGFEEKGEYYGADLGIPDASVYVSRVEAFLRLIGKPYVKKTTKGLTENPRGKVPFCNIKGSMVDDSGRIIQTLKNTFSVDVDAKLTPEQVATGHLVQQTLQGSLYFVLLHNFFATPEGRRIFADDMKKKLPPIISTLVSCMVFRGNNANLYGSGVGRMPHADIVKKGQADLRALGTVLGKQKFILGTKNATSYDSDLYAWLVQLFYDEAQIAQPWVNEAKKEVPNLVDYVDRMRKLLYPELSA